MNNDINLWPSNFDFRLKFWCKVILCVLVQISSTMNLHLNIIGPVNLFWILYDPIIIIFWWDCRLLYPTDQKFLCKDGLFPKTRPYVCKQEIKMCDTYPMIPHLYN